MNKFRILGVIAIIAIIANFFGGLDENWRDFKKGFEDGHNSAMEIYEPGRHIIPHHATSVKLNVEPLPETTVDSLSNNRVDWTLPYTVTEIETYAKPSAWHILVMGLAIPGIFLFLIGFCSLIRLLISISRREVFTSLLQSFYTKIVHKYKGLEANTKIFRPKFIVCRLKNFFNVFISCFSRAVRI